MRYYIRVTRTSAHLSDEKVAAVRVDLSVDKCQLESMYIPLISDALK